MRLLADAHRYMYGCKARGRSQTLANMESNDGAKKGIGFGLFLLLAGVAMLAQRLGWLPTEADWLFPAILIAWGAGELYQRLK
jgi:hypothetical protein